MYLPLALYQLWNAAKFQLFTRICVDNPCRLFVYLARLDTSIELDEITVFADLIYNCYSCKLKLKRLGKKTFLLTINLSYLGFRILDTAALNKSKATQRILGIQKEVTNADTTQVLNWTAGAVWKLLQSSKSEDWWGSSARIFVDVISFTKNPFSPIDVTRTPCWQLCEAWQHALDMWRLTEVAHSNVGFQLFRPKKDFGPIPIHFLELLALSGKY